MLIALSGWIYALAGFLISRLMVAGQRLTPRRERLAVLVCMLFWPAIVLVYASAYVAGHLLRSALGWMRDGHQRAGIPQR